MGRHFSLNPFSKYVRPNNIVSLLPGSLSASPSILTPKHADAGCLRHDLSRTSGKAYAIITVANGGVSPPTSVRIWFDTNDKGKEVAFNEGKFLPNRSDWTTDPVCS